MKNSFIVWFEDPEWNATYITCKNCGCKRFSIIDGNLLPWKIKLKCKECSKEQWSQADEPKTWIKFLESK